MIAAPPVPPALLDGRLVAILRRLPAGAASARIDALYAAGLRCIEVTMDSPHAELVIADAVRRYPDAAIGAGTVMDVSALERASQAGAAFLLSPDVNPDLITMAAGRGLPFIPGAFTATECVTARRAGAAAIKLFPAMPAGPGYLAALRQPLAGISFIPTGGVDESHVGAFLAAGAVAVAIGSSLSAMSPDELGAAVQRMMSEVAKAPVAA